MFANVARISRSPVSVDPHIAADAPSQLLQLLQESADAGLKFWIVGGRGQQYADASNAAGLLRPRCQRPGSRAAEKRDELASPHSITLSASASSVGGISTSNAFAVARLMTRSNLVASSTGKSPGFSPRRMRSTDRRDCERGRSVLEFNSRWKNAVEGLSGL